MQDKTDGIYGKEKMRNGCILAGNSEEKILRWILRKEDLRVRPIQDGILSTR
jgi:hypothetical protein